LNSCESCLADYLEVELEYLCGAGGVCLIALCELVLLEGRIVLWLDDLAVVLLLLPPAILASCSALSSFLGSLIVLLV
jgi:hypothetical protein